MFFAVYDASGSQGDAKGFIYVCGMLASEDKWFRMELEWKAVLKRFEVPYFHAKEFTQSRGPFAPWRDDEERRTEFLKELIRVIKRGVNKSFGHGVPLDDFRRVDRIYEFSERFGGAYTFCAGVSVASVKNWMHKKYPREPLLHVFEKGDSGQNDLRRLLPIHEQVDPIILSKIDPITKDWYVPFQAADLVAWEFRRGIDDFLYKIGAKPRASLRAMIQSLPTAGRIQNEEKLLLYAAWRRVTRRTPSQIGAKGSAELP